MPSGRRIAINRSVPGLARARGPSLKRSCWAGADRRRQHGVAKRECLLQAEEPYRRRRRPGQPEQPGPGPGDGGGAGQHRGGPVAGRGEGESHGQRVPERRMGEFKARIHGPQDPRPGIVGPSRRRWSSGVPTISSSRRICWLRVGWAMNIRSAACVKLPASAGRHDVTQVMASLIPAGASVAARGSKPGPACACSMSITYAWCDVLCFHLHSAERGTVVESTDSPVLPIVPRARHRVWLRRRLIITGFGRMFPTCAIHSPQSTDYEVDRIPEGQPPSGRQPRARGGPRDRHLRGLSGKRRVPGVGDAALRFHGFDARLGTRSVVPWSQHSRDPVGLRR